MALLAGGVGQPVGLAAAEVAVAGGVGGTSASRSTSAIAVVERRVEHRPDFRRSSKLVAGPVTNQLKGKSHPWAVPVRTNRRSSSQNSWVAVNSGTCP
jgi:hypothetical protein